jgi:hypothetical protein
LRLLSLLGELGIDFREIHQRQVELLEFGDGEAGALLGFRVTPGLADLGPALFLEDAADLRDEAAMRFLLAQTDAEELLVAVGADIGAKTLLALVLQDQILAVAATEQRKAARHAAVGETKDRLGAGQPVALEDLEAVLVELLASLRNRVERDERILEFGIRRPIDRVAFPVDAINVGVTDLLVGGRHRGDRAGINPVDGQAWQFIGNALLAHKGAAERIKFAAIRHWDQRTRALIGAVPRPAWLGYGDAADDAGDRGAVGASAIAQLLVSSVAVKPVLQVAK